MVVKTAPKPPELPEIEVKGLRDGVEVVDNTLNIETRKNGRVGSVTISSPLAEGRTFDEFIPGSEAKVLAAFRDFFYNKMGQSKEGDPLYAAWQAFNDIPMKNMDAVTVMKGRTRYLNEDGQYEEEDVYVVVYTGSDGKTYIGVITESGKYAKVEAEEAGKNPLTKQVDNTNFEGLVTYKPPVL